MYDLAEIKRRNSAKGVGDKLGRDNGYRFPFRVPLYRGKGPGAESDSIDNRPEFYEAALAAYEREHRERVAAALCGSHGRVIL